MLPRRKLCCASDATAPLSTRLHRFWQRRYSSTTRGRAAAERSGQTNRPAGLIPKFRAERQLGARMLAKGEARELALVDARVRRRGDRQAKHRQGNALPHFGGPQPCPRGRLHRPLDRHRRGAELLRLGRVVKRAVGNRRNLQTRRRRQMLQRSAILLARGERVEQGDAEQDNDDAGAKPGGQPQRQQRRHVGRLEARLGARRVRLAAHHTSSRTVSEPSVSAVFIACGVPLARASAMCSACFASIFGGSGGS